MKPNSKIIVLKIFLVLILCLSLFSATHNDIKYKCLPCGLDCDKEIFDKPGECSKCHMQLVESASITFRNIKPSKICDYLKSHPKTILLDVRTKEEFDGNADPNFGTLKNAVNIPIQELDTRLSEIEKYRKQEIIVYCSHSHRSPQAAYKLTQNGFKNVVNMSGGMSVLQDNTCKN
jgi:rhodanese-related sulfurtransferase